LAVAAEPVSESAGCLVAPKVFKTVPARHTGRGGFDSCPLRFAGPARGQAASVLLRRDAARSLATLITPATSGARAPCA
jgi:hypothetical protein